MLIKNLAAAATLFLATAAAPVFAVTATAALTLSPAAVTPALTNQLPLITPAPMLAQSIVPENVAALLAPPSASDADDSDMPTGADDTADADAAKHAAQRDVRDVAVGEGAGELRQALIDLAMNLRHIRYVRGGHSPSTGFDCSGFVRYVFSRALGLHLPTNSASQFRAGSKVKRADMQPGDLVFFRTAGRRGRGRVSHVGIYIADGKFIHSPTTGSSVRVDSLSNSYWSRRFAGAKRPEALAQIDLAAQNG